MSYYIFFYLYLFLFVSFSFFRFLESLCVSINFSNSVLIYYGVTKNFDTTFWFSITPLYNALSILLPNLNNVKKYFHYKFVWTSSEFDNFFIKIDKNTQLSKAKNITGKTLC